ncbi:MAG: Uma2 family endonuclease [Gemmatimonadetes bacterium]|nr:Uma2 family endonuclease [Gemmatimonadota bacterium]
MALEEYLALPDEDGYRTELVRGELVREPLPAPLHGKVVGRLCRRIGDHVETHALGEVFAESGYVLEEEPPTLRGPDVSFVSSGRLPERPGTGFWSMAPDLAVEVLSPSNRAGEVQDKVGQYLEAGARLVWVVDPVRGTAAEYRAGGEARLFGAADALDGGHVLPGFRLPLADLFRT